MYDLPDQDPLCFDEMMNQIIQSRCITGLDLRQFVAHLPKKKRGFHRTANPLFKRLFFKDQRGVCHKEFPVVEDVTENLQTLFHGRHDPADMGSDVSVHVIF